MVQPFLICVIQPNAAVKRRDMEINNLEVNILYFICNPLNGELQDGTINQRGLLEEFSDLPERSVTAAIDSMESDGLIRIDRSRSRLSITENGINRLQSSIACHIHEFDSCGCGSPIGWLQPGQYTGRNPLRRKTDDERI